jgi:hypothetical protein
MGRDFPVSGRGEITCGLAAVEPLLPLLPFLIPHTLCGLSAEDSLLRPIGRGVGRGAWGGRAGVVWPVAFSAYSGLLGLLFLGR